MTISSLPLSYCTNVHPGVTISEVESGLDQFSVPIRKNFGSDLAVGLWLASPVVQELELTKDAVKRFGDGLARRGLTCYTLNAFPYGDFHSVRVKENVYRPDWAQRSRLEYSLTCARVLAALLPEGGEGSISTVPLGFKPSIAGAMETFLRDCADQLIQFAQQLEKLHQRTGRLIRLAIEPEPYCVIETTEETLRFFERLRTRVADAKALAAVNTHLGVCYDICHQSVEFEDVAASIRSLKAANIRINKVHITCAIQVDSPGENLEARQLLSHYVEPRYLHQTFARQTDGKIVSRVDLDQALTSSPPPEFLDAPTWRVHYHVPVDADNLGPLGTTRTDLKRALSVIPELDYAPHLEVETYTWGVMPGGKSPNIVEGFAKELIATKGLLDGKSSPRKH